MPAVKRHWTTADLEQMPDDGNRYEVVDGELLVTPSPSLAHQNAVLELALILSEYLRRERVGHLVVAPAQITFSEARAVQPDLLVAPLVNGRAPTRLGEITQLRLAIEVLSPSTARADRVTKRALYRDQGVDEYWIVDLDARSFERSIPGDPRVEIFDDALAWHPAGAATPLLVELGAYFSRIS